MKAQTPVLQAKHREKLGSRYSQRVRKAGGLPAVVYGHGQDPVSISVDSRTALSHFHAGDKVFKRKVKPKSAPGYAAPIKPAAPKL